MGFSLSPFNTFFYLSLCPWAALPRSVRTDAAHFPSPCGIRICSQGLCLYSGGLCLYSGGQWGKADNHATHGYKGD